MKFLRQNSLYLLLALLPVSALVSVSIGPVSLSLPEMAGILAHLAGAGKLLPFTEQQETVLLFIRLPRLCLSLCVGAGLALAGALMQGLFRNPLADPGLVGISSGASLFAVLTIMVEIKFFQFLPGLAGAYALSLMAFSGACLTALAVYQFARISGHELTVNLLLTGVGVNALAGAVVGLLMYLASNEQLRSITFWGFGSLAGADWVSVLAVLPFTGAALAFTPRLAKSLNLLALGESQAMHLGVSLKALRRQVIVLATLAVGASVAVAGMIGFVGFVVPHLVRRLAGSDHRRVLPGSALGGAALLTLADAASRLIVAPAELPIGILTALIGTPVLLWILTRRQ